MTFRTREEIAIDQAIGLRIKGARVFRGLTQGQVADMLGISYQQMQKYEKGQNRVSGSRMLAICKTLDITPNSLFEDYEEKGDKSEELGFISYQSPHYFDNQFFIRINRLSLPHKKLVSTVIAALLEEQPDDENDPAPTTLEDLKRNLEAVDG